MSIVIVRHEVYEEMYYIEWEDGSRSDDFYNKSRANWFRQNIERARDFKSQTLGVRSPAGAFKS